MIEQISIDLSNYCSKECPFCYNHSNRRGETLWKVEEIISFAISCISNGVKAISFGGGEPFEFNGIFDIIDELKPLCYVSVTTNGFPLLKEETINCLSKIKPDKIHLTIHQPECEKEVARIIKQISLVNSLEIKPGANLLVANDKIIFAKNVYEKLLKFLSPQQIILIPQRFSKTPSAKQLAYIALNQPFQAPSCLLGCNTPKNFVSISWDKKVNFCSYAGGGIAMKDLTFEGLVEALANIRFQSCQI